MSKYHYPLVFIAVRAHRQSPHNIHYVNQARELVKSGRIMGGVCGERRGMPKKRGRYVCVA